MFVRQKIIGLLPFLFEKKLSAKMIALTIGTSENYVYKVAREQGQGKPEAGERGHRQRLFSEKQREIIKGYYRDLILDNGDTPSMTVLREILIKYEPKLPVGTSESYRNIVKEIPEYPVKQKGKTYRKRFEAPAVGFLLQGDVTTHAWAEWCYPLPMLAFIDDKSRYVLYARIIDGDNIENHKKAILEWITKYGKPVSVYYDNDPKYAKNGEIRRIVEQLGINVINSKPYQPQRKGKIERKFRTFQKQFGFYVKMEKAKNIKELNECLEKYIDKHNQTYSRAIGSTPEKVFKSSEDVFRYLTPDELKQIELIFARQDSRKVNQVNEISFRGIHLTIPMLGNIPLAGRRVELFICENKWLKIYYQNRLVIEFTWEDLYA